MRICVRYVLVRARVRVRVYVSLYNTVGTVRCASKCNTSSCECIAQASFGARVRGLFDRMGRRRGGPQSGPVLPGLAKTAV